MIASILAALASFFPTLLKYKKYIFIALAVVAAVVALKMWTNSIYERGYQAGIALLDEEKARHELAVVEWENKILLQQTAHIEAVRHIMQDYEEANKALDEEIDKLKSNPKVVYKYVAKDTKCAIPKGFVALHNTAAKGAEMVDEEQSQEVTDKTLSEVAGIVADNYYQCNKTTQQLIALQNVVRSYQEKQKELSQ